MARSHFIPTDASQFPSLDDAGERQGTNIRCVVKLRCSQAVYLSTHAQISTYICAQTVLAQVSVNNTTQLCIFRRLFSLRFLFLPDRQARGFRPTSHSVFSLSAEMVNNRVKIALFLVAIASGQTAAFPQPANVDKVPTSGYADNSPTIDVSYRIIFSPTLYNRV